MSTTASFFDIRDNTTFSGDLSTVGNVTSLNESLGGTFPAWTVGSVCVCLVGMLSNTLIVLSLTPLRYSAFITLLITLACVDNLFLFNVILDKPGIFGYIFFEPTSIFCCMTIFLINTSGILSSWLIVFISLERYVAVFYPLKVSVYCTKRKSVIAILVVTVLSGVGSAHTFLSCSVTSVNGIHSCHFLGAEVLGKLVFLWGYGLIYCVLPCIVVTVLNISISKKIKSQDAFRNKMQVYHAPQPSVRRDRSLTVMAAAVSLVFILCTFPTFLLLLTDYSCKYLQGVTCISDGWPFQVVFTLDHINHGVNFYLYCLSGSLFRKALLRLIRHK